MEIPNNRVANLTLPSDREIVITRDFHAPRRLVFDAWSNREQVPRWYGCREFTMTACEIDLREGGRWRWALLAPDGVLHTFSGEYREIVRPERLVFTERYEPVPGSDHVVALSFEERAGATPITTMTQRMLYPSSVQRDGHLQSGMERGLQDTLRRLDELVMAAGSRSASAGRQAV